MLANKTSCHLFTKTSVDTGEPGLCKQTVVNCLLSCHFVLAPKLPAQAYTKASIYHVHAHAYIWREDINDRLSEKKHPSLSAAAKEWERLFFHQLCWDGLLHRQYRLSLTCASNLYNFGEAFLPFERRNSDRHLCTRSINVNYETLYSFPWWIRFLSCFTKNGIVYQCNIDQMQVLFFFFRLEVFSRSQPLCDNYCKSSVKSITGSWKQWLEAKLRITKLVLP